MVEDWQIGVCTSCLSSFLGTLGVQWRILSLHYEDNELARSRCLQALGWTFWLTGQALGQVAIMLTPSTIVACVQFSSCLFFNAVLAPFVLHEHLTWKHGLGILLLSGGGCTVTEVSTHTDQAYTLDQLYAFGQRPFFLLTMAICFGAALALTARTASRRHLDSVSFAYFWALCGAIDLLLTKFTLLMLRLWAVAADGAEVPSPLVLVSFVAIMLLSHLLVLACQVVSTNYGEALQNMPLFMASGAMMQVALGGIFFDEFREFGATRFTFFYVGFSLMLAGLGVTSHTQASAPPPAPPLSEPLVAPPAADDVPVLSSGEFTWSIARKLRNQSADWLLVGGAERTAMCFGTSWGPHPVEPRKAVFRTQSDAWAVRAESRIDTRNSGRWATDPKLDRDALKSIAALHPAEGREDE